MDRKPQRPPPVDAPPGQPRSLDDDLTRSGQEHMRAWLWVGVFNACIVAAVFLAGRALTR